MVAVAAGARAEERPAIPGGPVGHPHSSFRPADGRNCDVNPPRFSCHPARRSASPTTPVPVREFVFQLSARAAGHDLEFAPSTNAPAGAGRHALAVAGTRGGPPERWSAARTFTLAQRGGVIAPSSARRSGSRRATPELRPANGDWALARRLAGTEPTATWLAGVLDADAVTQRPWGATSRRATQGQSRCMTKVADIGAVGGLRVFLRLTNDPRYLPAKQHAVALALSRKAALGGFMAPPQMAHPVVGTGALPTGGMPNSPEERAVL